MLPSLMGNVGYVAMNHALERHSFQTSTPEASRAESPLWLETVLNWTPDEPRLHGLFSFLIGAEQATMRYFASAGESALDFVLRGNSAAAEGNSDLAETWYRLALERAPDLADGWYYLGLLYENNARPLDAIAAFRKGIAAARSQIAGKSDLLLHLGLVYMQLIDPPQRQAALSAYNEAFAAGDFRLEKLEHAHFSRATVLQQLGRSDAAIDEYREVLERTPTHYWALVRLAEILHRTQHQSVEAEQFLLVAIKTMPMLPKAYLDLAGLYADVGRNDDADRVYRALLEVVPDNQTARNALGNQ